MFKRKADEEMRFDIVEQLYRSEYQGMMDFAAYLLGSKNLAETAVQEAFVCALDNIHKLEKSPNQVGWLYNVLKNVIRHMRRDHQLLVKTFMHIGEGDETKLTTNDEYSLAFIGDEDSSKDPDLRLLVLFYIYGYTLKEIADEEKTSVSAIKMRIKRAKDRVKEKYHLE